MKRFAQNTSVSVGKSRGEIDSLLRQWGCKGVQWTDEFEAGLVTLRFRWEHEGCAYMARFSVNLPTDEELSKSAVDGRTTRTTWSDPKVSDRKLEKLRETRGQQEHRLLLLWLKAAFNAVDAHIVTAEEIFLPFLEGKDGRTVAEVAIPKMADLLSGNANRLLTTGKS